MSDGKGFNWSSLMPFASLGSGLFSGILGMVQQDKNNAFAREQAARQHDYDMENVQYQFDLNRQAAAESYGYETNYADRMQKMMQAGVNPHYAAQYISGSSARVDAPQSTAQQAALQQANYSDMIAAINGLPAGLAEYDQHRLLREKFANDKKQWELEQKLKERKLNSEMELDKLKGRYMAGQISALEYKNKMDKIIDNMDIYDTDTDTFMPKWQYDAKYGSLGQKASVDKTNDDNTRAWNADSRANTALGMKLEEHASNMIKLDTQISLMKKQGLISDVQHSILTENLKKLEHSNSPQVVKWLDDILESQASGAKNQHLLIKAIDNSHMPNGVKTALKVVLQILGGAASKVSVSPFRLGSSSVSTSPTASPAGFGGDIFEHTMWD